MSQTPRHYAFRDGGLDRAEHLRNDTDALSRLWPDAQILLIDAEGQAHFSGSLDGPEFVRGADVLSDYFAAASFLGLDGDSGWFALPAQALSELPELRLDLRTAATQWPASSASIFAQGRALLHWQQHNKFCGKCGQLVFLQRGGFAAVCAHCALEHYPRTDAAIIVAVSDGERLLLGRQSSWPENRWSVLAGFLEPGESLEQTVVREVMEEAGVRVHACQYLASQPWPFPSALMLGFRADAEPQAVVVGAELEDARWFTAAELRTQTEAGQMQLSPHLSISRWLIDDWLAEH